MKQLIYIDKYSILKCKFILAVCRQVSSVAFSSKGDFQNIQTTLPATVLMAFVYVTPYKWNPILPLPSIVPWATLKILNTSSLKTIQPHNEMVLCPSCTSKPLLNHKIRYMKSGWHKVCHCRHSLNTVGLWIQPHFFGIKTLRTRRVTFYTKLDKHNSNSIKTNGRHWELREKVKESDLSAWLQMRHKSNAKDPPRLLSFICLFLIQFKENQNENCTHSVLAA